MRDHKAVGTSKTKATWFRMRVTPADLARWRAAAARNGLTLSEYCRRRICERPLKAEKLPYKDKQRLEREALLEQAAAERARITQAERNAAYERRAEADRLSAAAGGAEAWFAKMTPAERERWGDLKGVLLQTEQLKREGDAGMERFRANKTKWDDLSDYLPSESAKSVPREPPKPAPAPKPETEAEKLARERADWERAREDAFRQSGILW